MWICPTIGSLQILEPLAQRAVWPIAPRKTRLSSRQCKCNDRYRDGCGSPDFHMDGPFRRRSENLSWRHAVLSSQALPPWLARFVDEGDHCPLPRDNYFVVIGAASHAICEAIHMLKNMLRQWLPPGVGPTLDQDPGHAGSAAEIHLPARSLLGGYGGGRANWPPLPSGRTTGPEWRAFP